LATIVDCKLHARLACRRTSPTHLKAYVNWELPAYFSAAEIS
jgi:hypothetical protein